jgi:hypothetical protein
MLTKLIIFGSALAVLLATAGTVDKLQIMFKSALPVQQAVSSHQAALSEQQMAPPTVAVVGTGLAGLSAAYELSFALQAELPEARVVVFEKNKFLGGNSMKASSGINAVNPAAEDTEAIYAEDTRKSGGGLSKEDLVAQLVVSCNCCCCYSSTLQTSQHQVLDSTTSQKHAAGAWQHTVDCVACCLLACTWLAHLHAQASSYQRCSCKMIWADLSRESSAAAQNFSHSSIECKSVF